MQVTVIPCLKDNYAYLLHSPGSPDAVVVDASEAEPVLTALERLRLNLSAILSTHHHLDHVGGNEALRQRFPAVRVFGHVSDKQRIPGQTDFLSDGSAFEVGGLGFKAMHIPGHTLGAVAYATEDAVFTGDTLFIAGCGRLFEGTAAQMYESLNLKIGSLPDHTRVYCGHEYTLSNLRFAAHLEPANAAISKFTERAAELRQRGQPTVPSTLGEERQVNPFLRCSVPEIVAAVRDRVAAPESPEAVFSALRAAKDKF